MTDNRGGSPIDDVERALTDMLHRRADTIHESSTISFADVAPSTPRWSGRRTPALVSAVAACVITVTALGSFALTHHDRKPGPNAATPTSSPVATSATPSPKTAAGLTSCTLSPSALHSALAKGKVRVDEPVNIAVGAGPDGTFLMDQDAYTATGTQTHAELALFDRNHGQTVWLAHNPAQNVADVDVDSAVSKDWVVYAVRQTGQGPDAAIYAWRRDTGRTVTVRVLSTAEQHSLDLNLSAPIVIGDTAYWLEESVQGSHDQRIVGRDLTTGRTVMALGIHNVVRLLNVGGAISWVSSAGADAQTLHIGGGAAGDLGLPTVGGEPASSVTSDGSTVRWQSGTGSSWHAYSATVAFGNGRAGLSHVATTTVRQPFTDWGGFAGPLLLFPGPNVGAGGGTGDVVVDTQTARAMTWPPGTQVDLVSGDSVIVHIDGTPSSSSAPDPRSVSRLSLGTLRALPCR